MPTGSQNHFQMPYRELVRPLLKSILGALSDLCATPYDKQLCGDEAVNKHFLWLQKEVPRRAPHLFASREYERSLRTRTRNRPNYPTRISRLVFHAFDRANTLSEQNLGAFLPSPLEILLEYLTIPTEPASGAYAFATLRLFLFEAFGLWPATREIPQGFKPFSFRDIEKELSSIRTHVEGRDNIDIRGSPVKVMLSHFLAMKGMMHLRFGTLKDKSPVDDSSGARSAYCRSGTLTPEDGYEFRAREDMERLPEAAEIINELWGVPLPIRGADTVFFHGLRFSSEGGLVVAVGGGAGTGKTSLALGLAAVLAPLGARTFYVSAEEPEKDIEARLETLTPLYFGQLPKVPEPQKGMFQVVRISPFEPAQGLSPRETLRGLLDEIKTAAQRNLEEALEGLPVPCPLIVVLDGIQSYFVQTHQQQELLNGDYPLERFIQDCREVGVLVILASAVDSNVIAALDYLVDVVIRLEYRHTERPDEKPLRVLRLLKTRHQISRPGAHIFHLSGPDGIRIAPQLPSQLDRRALMKVRRPDENRTIDVLNRRFSVADLPKIDHEAKRPFRVEAARPSRTFLDIFPRSHILVHGRGSSGKAGFGLKLLITPVLERKKRGLATGKKARVLVVSFLYPRPYYDTLLKNLNRLLPQEYKQEYSADPSVGSPDLRPSDLEVLTFYPGHLNPEDLFSKIIRRLGQAELEGEPFAGVLLDGVHNVFLQFPRLENYSMVWPMLYDVLRRQDLTVVTTHTTISLGYEEDSDEDYDLTIRKAKPLLHAIVQAADFFLNLSEEPRGEQGRSPDDEHESKYVLSVKSAIGQAKPTNHVYWHREKLVVYDDPHQK